MRFKKIILVGLVFKLPKPSIDLASYMILIRQMPKQKPLSCRSSENTFFFKFWSFVCFFQLLLQANSYQILKKWSIKNQRSSGVQVHRGQMHLNAAKPPSWWKCLRGESLDVSRNDNGKITLWWCWKIIHHLSLTFFGNEKNHFDLVVLEGLYCWVDACVCASINQP